MSLRMTEEEYAALMARQNVSEVTAAMLRRNQPEDKPKRQKYGNHRVEINGMKFDSKHEAEVYLQLDARLRAGELKCILRQVPIDLPGGIKYIADFVTIRPDMSIEAVIDAKSAATRQNRVYINKKKQVRACWGIEIQEV